MSDLATATTRLLEGLRNLPATLNELEMPVSDYSHLALVEANAEYIAKSGVIPLLLKTAREYAPQPIASLALINLVNLAIHPVTHDVLLEAGSLEVALSLLTFLESTKDSELDCGMSAAFLICRTVGKTESGPGPEAISGNPLLIEKVKWILGAVLDAGPDGYVIGSGWNPANIMLDISILATSDRNKPLLVGFVQLITRSLIERAPNNARLVKYAVQALSQLYFEPRCRADFVTSKQALIEVLQKHSSDEGIDPETTKSGTVLWNSLMSMDAKGNSLAPSPKPIASTPRMNGLVSRVMGGRKASSGKASSEPVGHVMISYQWDSQPVAIAIQECLAKANIKTWFDLNDMGPNINDSMAYAVENCWAVIVLYERKYKESGNCRKECEMADTLQKPLVFVKLEKDYKPEAWLALVMGKARWIDCSSPELVPKAMPQILKHLSQLGSQGSGIKMPASPPRAAVSVNKTGAASSSPASGSDPVIVLLNQVLADLATLKSDVKALRDEMHAFKRS